MGDSSIITDLEAQAILIAAIKTEETEKFLNIYRSTEDLRKLPKAHLHIHSNCCIRNNHFKDKLNEFNSIPNVESKLKEIYNEKMENAHDTKSQNQINGLFTGEKLKPPQNSFWHEDGSLKVLTLDELAALCPSPGLTGFNEPENMWHGMGACRDSSTVANIAGTGPVFHGSCIDANEDARAEGIRWVEYMHGFTPKINEDSGTFSDEDWNNWKNELLAMYSESREKIPEVDFTFINISASADPKLIEKFCQFKENDPDLKNFKFGIHQVGSDDPLMYKTQYETAKLHGLPIVNTHAGEWNPERLSGINVQREWMRNAISIGASRIGHGIISHTDAALMQELKEKDICLEVCLFSNNMLDNIPGGDFSKHPLPILHRAGVPCCLASDDPWQMGAWNTHGLVREYEIARDKLGMTNSELAQLAKNSFKYSLAPESLKSQAYKDIDKWLEEISLK